jgi:sulfocyanin
MRARQYVTGLGLLVMVPAWSGGAVISPDDKWVSYDPSTKTVTFQLTAGAPGGNSGGFNFDGYANGGATLVVPSKSNVIMNFVNDDGTAHSAAVVPDVDPIPIMVGDPAISGAETQDVTQGLPQGGKDVIKFTAPDSGSYRIICGVPGHAQSGMWIRLRVDPAAKTPALVTGK